MEKVVQVIPARKAEAVRKEKRKLRVAAYCRVSTEQEEQLGSFANQVEYYTRLIEDEENWELAGIYADEGISGTGTRKRKGFQRLIEACDEGRVDFVIDFAFRTEHSGLSYLCTTSEGQRHPDFVSEGEY